MRRIHFSVLSIVFFLTVLSPMRVHAATLLVAPSAASITVGDTVALTVRLNSAGVAVNNAEGSLSFSPSMFDLVSVQKDASLFTIWISAPSYDGNGTIAFNGGLPSPGYEGRDGFLFKVVLRAKSPGTSAVALSNAAVRANDGLGTDVYTGSADARVTVQAPVPTPPQAPTPSAPLTPAETTTARLVTLTSPTHPLQDAWYGATAATIALALPSGATAIETALSSNPNVVPLKVYKTAITEKILADLPDGVSYFIARARVGGTWSASSVYKLQIDSQKPLLSASFTFDQANNTLTMLATASDIPSGIAGYTVLVDGATTTTLAPEAFATGASVVTIDAAAGVHQVTLRVFDFAGNYTDISNSITVLARPSLSGGIVSRIQSLMGMGMFIGFLLGILLVSIALNIYLWIVLREEKRRPSHDIIRLRTSTKQKLLDLKRDLNKQGKLLEHEHARKTRTPQETEYVQKMRAQLADAEEYIDGKIKRIR